MASLQANFLKGFLKLDKILTGSGEELDISKERIKLEKTARMFRFSQEIKSEPISIYNLPAEWILPAEKISNRTILYFHGGSYNAGSIRTHHVLVANIATASKARALIVDYRLAPEFPFPAAIEDAKLAYKWLLENGCTPDEVVLAGDSAGGGLTLALLHAIKKSKLRMPAAAVCLSPWTDLAGKGESISKNAKKDILLNSENLRKSASIYIGKTNATDPFVSPIYGDLEEFPPLLIQVGSDELLLSDSSDFAEKAKAAGVDVTLEIWKEMQHVWQFAGSMVPESRQAIAAIGRFIDNRLSKQ